MIDTTLSGLRWAQTRFPTSAYVNAVWDSRYPQFADGNNPRAKGAWPFKRALPANTQTNVTLMRSGKRA